MATTSKVNASAKVANVQVSPGEVCTSIFLSSVSENEARSMTATEAVVQDLMAKGIPKEKMRIPGKVISHICSVADNFDAPLEDFKDYL